MNKRTKACSISHEVKCVVYKRDRGLCIFCGNPGLPEAHYIPRSHGGLGIEQNILTVCPRCHHRLDQTSERNKLLQFAKEHLELWYPGFPDAERIYHKE